MTLLEYIKHRRRFEIGAWALFVLIQVVANTAVTWFDVQRVQLDYQLWEIVSWEFSSNLVIGVLVLLILWFDHRFPLTLGSVRKHVAAHLLFTIPFSLIHVAVMVSLRKLVYQFHDKFYNFGPFPREYLYEYLKDFRTYFSILAVIYLYRFVLSRLRGEARYIAEGEDTGSASRDRFLVKKLGREFLVRVPDIDWIESAGNYVTLHVSERLYPLRETMTRIQTQVEEHGFARVHRTAIVNLDRVAHMEPDSSGDATLMLKNGAAVPVSRRYRQELRHRLGESTVSV